MALLQNYFLGQEVRTWLTSILPITYAIYWVAWIVYCRTLHPLARIPGPFWASVSRTWVMYHSGAGDLEKQHLALHKKYGPLVRVAPNEIVCNDPREIPTVYPLARPLEKTSWYDAWRPQGMGSRPDMFTNRSERDHSQYQRTIGSVYSLTNVLKSEAELDRTLELFLERLGEFADKDEVFDFGKWLEMYCYDNIGIVWFGKQFGFLKDSIDYGNYIKAVHLAMPFLHVLAASPAYIRPFLMLGAICVPKLLKAVIAVDGIKKTAERETSEAQARTEEDTAKRADMTSALLRVVREKGEKNRFGLREIVSENWTAIMAGSDSTSIAMRSVFYYLMKHPETLDKAREEVDDAFNKGILMTPVQYIQAIRLPYLEAVIMEAMRLYAPFAVPLQRYTPAQGLTVCGTYIPKDFRIGLSPAIVQLHPVVFGNDAQSWRPERWLEASPEQLKMMKKSMMHFGAGTRTCTGQHVAMTEINKVIPEILRHFDFKLSHDGDWVTQNAAFNIQQGVTCYFKKRALVP